MTPVEFEDEALVEALSAYEWYEGRGEGLGQRFRDALDVVVARIAENPTAFPVYYADLRRALVERFPYAVHYRCYPTHAAVVAVFHGKRNPKILKKR